MEMEMIQTSVLEASPWLPWFLQKDFAGSTTAGVETLDLPADFLLEIEESNLYLQTAEGVWLRLVKKDLEVVRSLTIGEAQPRYYAIAGEKIYLGPTPDAEYSVKMEYYGKDTPMAEANVETAWLREASDVVIAELGKVLAENHLQNPEQAASFATAANTAWDRLYRKHVDRLETNNARALGGNS